MFADALFATQSVLERLHKNHWEYLIYFSRNKLKNFTKLLNSNKEQVQSIPGQPYYRERQQEFHWYNDINWGYDFQLKLHLVSCIEKWSDIDKKHRRDHYQIFATSMVIEYSW